MKIKLLTICFAAAVSVCCVNGMNLVYEYNDHQDAVTDQSAITGVSSLAEFADLPDNRVERLNSGFVADARRANTRLTILSEVQTVAELIPLTWLPEALRTDLTTANTELTALLGTQTLPELLELTWLPETLRTNLTTINTRLTGLSGAQTLPELLALNTSWLQPTLIQAIRRADIKLGHNLPASLYENIENIPEDNTIGTQISAVRNGDSSQPAAEDDVSKALEILYNIIVTVAGIDSGVEGAKVDTTDNYFNFYAQIFPDVDSFTTANYLKFLSGILVDGRNDQNDFSKISTNVMREFVYSLGRMIDCATDADLGIEIEEGE